MSRVKKSRSLKQKLKIKTGSRKEVLSGKEKGRIPSKNRLQKHRKRLKSAYQKHLEESASQDTSSGHVKRPEPADRPDSEKQAVPDRDNSSSVNPERSFDDLSAEELWQAFD